MQRREKIVAFVLIVGVFLVIAAINVELAMMAPEVSSTDTSQGEWLKSQLIKWGSIITLVGVFLLLVVYLTRRWGRERSYSGAKITALFCINPKGEITVHSAGYAPNELRYCARIRLLNGESDEFECSYALFQRLREGMIGRAVCKGNQLLAFLPDSGDLERG